MNWQNLFAPHILTRGYDYYIEGAVDKLKIGVNEITARVLGTIDYKVQIDLFNNREIAMSCNCPYAEAQLYDRLLVTVQNTKGIVRLQKYEKVLSPLYPK